MNPLHTQSGFYLPHIDGLRTIAVFSVFFFHLSPTSLSGGFVGVDIFFVISGYLITNILKTGIENNNFRFGQFYIRRIKRLFPAFAVVLLLCTIASYIILNPLGIMNFAHSAMYAVASISNIYFYLSSGYFAPAAESQILLHTWSLAVEEQFYLICPLLTYLLITRIPRDLQFVSILIFTLTCIVISIWVTHQNPNISFYLTPFRVAEFAIGGILCWLNRRSHTKVTYEVGTLIGLGLILYSIFFIHPGQVFPGSIVYAPCLGTALMIYFSGSSFLGQRLIGNNIMAYLGRISYPIYLVHWPLIVFTKIVLGDSVSIQAKFFILIATLVLAGLIHKYVEQTLKTQTKFWNINKIAVNIFACCLVTFMVFYTQMFYFKGLPGQVPPAINSIIESIETEKQQRFQLNNHICISNKTNSCEKKLKQRVVVLGDSHGPDAINLLYPNYPNFDFVLQNVGGCPPLSLDDFKKFIKPSKVYYQKCTEQTLRLADPAFYTGADYLVFSILYSGWYNGKQLDNFLNSTDFPKDIKILILGNAPSFTQPLPELIVSYNKLNGLNKHIASSINSWTWEYEEQIRELAQVHGAKFISKLDFFCANADRSCDLFYGETNSLLTYDKQHLSFEAARIFGQFLKAKHPSIEQLFKIN